MNADSKAPANVKKKMSKTFEGVSLRVSSAERLATFYTDTLGMFACTQGSARRLHFTQGGGVLSLTNAQKNNPYRALGSDRYWKIGITVPNLDLAAAQLADRGLVASTPQMFENIGYLCHLQDPEGFQIELLQHTFQDKPSAQRFPVEGPLGGGPCLAHVTLRTSDIATDLTNYRDRLGMTLLSRQAVPAYGFTLYFLAHTNERPPDPDLDSVDNRPWLWQRPYPVLELQAFNPTTRQINTVQNETGFDSLLFEPDSQATK